MILFFNSNWRLSRWQVRKPKLDLIIWNFTTPDGIGRPYASQSWGPSTTDNSGQKCLAECMWCRAPHINGTAKLSNKRLRGPRSTDAQKNESMFVTIDRIEAKLSFVDDLWQYPLSTYSNLNGWCYSLEPTIDALAFMGSESKVQKVGLRTVTNNTSAKKRRPKPTANLLRSKDGDGGPRTIRCDVGHLRLQTQRRCFKYQWKMSKTS